MAVFAHAFNAVERGNFIQRKVQVKFTTYSIYCYTPEIVPHICWTTENDLLCMCVCALQCCFASWQGYQFISQIGLFHRSLCIFVRCVFDRAIQWIQCADLCFVECCEHTTSCLYMYGLYTVGVFTWFLETLGKTLQVQTFVIVLCGLQSSEDYVLSIYSLRLQQTQWSSILDLTTHIFNCCFDQNIKYLLLNDIQKKKHNILVLPITV